MYTGIGRSLGTDYFRIADQLTGEELSYLRRTRDFVDNDVLPVINGYWERAEFPWPLIEKLAKLGVVGDGIDGYGKGSLRAVWQAEITLSGVRVPEENRLPGANSFKDAGRVLAGTRNSVAWGALGHATAAYEAAMAYCRQRQQFGKPLVSFQVVQDRLVKMLAEICSMQLYCLRLGRLIEEGKLTDTIAAIAKMNNTRKARQVIAEARDLLGGNGILLDFHVMRHLADIEAIHTYEGTETIQTLIVGRDITGASAFA
jgi:glutaryl-CoA dehydrogenase